MAVRVGVRVGVGVAGGGVGVFEAAVAAGSTGLVAVVWAVVTGVGTRVESGTGKVGLDVAAGVEVTGVGEALGWSASTNQVIPNEKVPLVALDDEGPTKRRRSRIVEPATAQLPLRAATSH